MTTTVKISAHLSSEKEVRALIRDDQGAVLEELVLQDGETAERYVYDERRIEVREVVK